jgi:hypothetical protein
VLGGPKLAATLIADLVATLEEVEREQRAQLVERLEPPFPGTIAWVIRDRRPRS